MGQQYLGHRQLARDRALPQRFARCRHEFFQPSDTPGFVGIESQFEQERQHVGPIGRDGMADEAVAVLERAVGVARSQPGNISRRNGGVGRPSRRDLRRRRAEPAPVERRLSSSSMIVTSSS